MPEPKWVTIEIMNLTPTRCMGVVPIGELTIAIIGGRECNKTQIIDISNKRLKSKRSWSGGLEPNSYPCVKNQEGNIVTIDYFSK